MTMRLDKFLKVSRLIKRRTVASSFAQSGKVEINGRVAKPGNQVKPGDVLTIAFGETVQKFTILSTEEHVRKEDADRMYRQEEQE